jgi:hypothetical protein
MEFKHTVQESRDVVRKSEHWGAEVDGYDVYVNRRDDDVYSVGVNPNAWRRNGYVDTFRLPLLSFYPKNVADLEVLAERLPSILKQLAAGMRAWGLEDLRSDADRRMEEMDAERERFVASMLAGEEKGQ